MLIEMWPLSRLKPYDKNPRVRSKKSISKIAASIKEFGFRQPIVADENDVILVGHGRRDGAAFLGMTEVPVHQALGLTPAQKHAYRIADNRTNEETEWDEDLLKFELRGLADLNFDLSLTGFDLRAVNGYLRSGPVDGEDDVPEPGPPVTKPGDLWVMGEHRLLCGDASNTEAVKFAFPAHCMWTDPPYGVNYVGKTKHALEISSDRAEDTSVIAGAISAARNVLVQSAPFYVAHPPGARMWVFAQILEAQKWRIHQQLIWVKDSMVLGHSDYHFQHEPILYGFTPGVGRAGRGNHAGTHWYGDDSQVSVFNIPRPKRSEEHPTAKPVELVRRCILNSTIKGDAVYDPFLGSGTTIIAAESEGRRCYGLEIEPRYCDVIVARWQKFTGKQATLEGYGATFEHVAHGRQLGAQDEIAEEVLNA